MLSLGRYPETTLAEARERRDEARKLLTNGRDPSEQRKQAKADAAKASANSFEAVARKWLARQDVAQTTAIKNSWLLETFAIPALGHIPIAEVTPREILTLLRKIESNGKLETAQRVKQKIGQVCRYATIEGMAASDPTSSLRGAIKTPKTRHHAAITEPKAIGALLRAIDGFEGSPVTLAALRLLPLVFVRPGELRHADWSEFDLDEAIWRIAAKRMKMKVAHLVPLSEQAVAILRELYPLTGSSAFVLPGVRSASRPMSENTINGALRRLGYAKDEMTGHGFRAMASSRLNELGWNADAIERQLAHAESNAVRAAYSHGAAYLDERRKMMQSWSDYLDSLRTAGNVIPLRTKRA
jgi:integrase